MLKSRSGESNLVLFSACQLRVTHEHECGGVEDSSGALGHGPRPSHKLFSKKSGSENEGAKKFTSTSLERLKSWEMCKKVELR